MEPLALNGLPRTGGGGALRTADGPARPAPPAAASAPPPAQTVAMMRQAIDNANRALVEKGRELTFEFDDDVGRVIVKLVDRNTGEVLRQVPSPEMVEIARRLERERAAGALLRVRA
jgi:flagellar protein FlaG